MSRPLKDSINRRVCSFRLTDEAILAISSSAKLLGVSCSDIVQDYAIGILKWRLDAGYPIPDWNDRSLKI